MGPSRCDEDPERCGYARARRCTHVVHQGAYGMCVSMCCRRSSSLGASGARAGAAAGGAGRSRFSNSMSGRSPSAAS
eukprot:15092527-Alexandrium_andersonii.AAC.1